MTMFQLVLCLILILYGEISTCKPLSPEDVEGLLPPTPRDKNETIAAVVQDPVVQDAVQHAASNGSLNGLVVKKNVYIMPASNPNMEVQSGPQQNMMDPQSFFERESIQPTLPEDQSKKVAVPIVAVIDPSKAEKGKVNSPIVAILPNQLSNDAVKNQVQFLNDNSDVIQKKAQNYVDQSSLTIVPDYWMPSTSSQIITGSSPNRETVSVPLSSWPNQQEEEYPKPITMSRWEMIVPAYQDDNADYSREKGDMDVAEDIIFRPLFRYRQETQQRSRYYDDSNRYDDYPRRAYFYRPRYNDY